MSASRYRKLLEAAKDVDSFTRLVLERYAELNRHLPLNHDEDAVDALRQTSCDQDVLSLHDPTSVDDAQRRTDDTQGTHTEISLRSIIVSQSVIWNKRALARYQRYPWRPQNVK